MRYLLLATCFAAALAAKDDPREIMRRAVQAALRNDEAAAGSGFQEREDRRMLDGAGRVKSRKLQTWEVIPVEGSPYYRLVARDDRPLSPAEQQVEAEKLLLARQDRAKESAAERARRIGDWNRKRQRRLEPIEEMPDAFDFRIGGEERAGGVDAWIIEATPHPGYKPRSQVAGFFPKVKGRIWVGKDHYQWIRVEMESMDPISIESFFLRLSKGSRITIEQARVNGDLWLPKQVNVIAAARLLFVKEYRFDLEYNFSNYRFELR